LLYARYPTVPTAFSAGDFEYDFMGLESYDVQAYANDGSQGVPEVDVLPLAPAYFQDQLTWIFPTHWYADGVTAVPAADNLYGMGPSGYALAGAVSMTHLKNTETNVLATFFDPALINTRLNRTSFLEHSIEYLLYPELGVAETAVSTLRVFPNPATDEVTIAVTTGSAAAFSVLSTEGKAVATGTFSNGMAIADLSLLSPGIYFLTTDASTETVKIVKQ